MNCSRFALLVALMPASAIAQTAPAPVPLLPPPAAVVQPVPPPPPPVVLPTLTEPQEARLRAWLGEGAAHGVGRAPAADLAGEALVRAALDHARVLQSGRLAESDFIEEWALRPAPADPLPAFAKAVETDKLGRWIVDVTPPYSGYEGLRKGLTAYRKIKADGGWKTLRIHCTGLSEW